jgi:anti-sigma regulatory factor (Ser/Thr protein kinase)
MNGGTGSVDDCPVATPGMSADATVDNSGVGTAYQEYPLESVLEFRPLPTAVPCARLHAKNMLFEWRLPDLTDGAELLVSELMTNALAASRPEYQFHDFTTITLRLRASSRHLVIEVWDRSPEDPAITPIGDDAEYGRGLTIVDALASRWGYARTAAYRKVVWAELLVPAPAGSFLDSGWHRAQPGSSARMQHTELTAPHPAATPARTDPAQPVTHRRGDMTMTDTGTTSSDPEPTLEDVAHEFPAWHCYAPGMNSRVFANLPGSSPLVVLSGEDPADLRDEIRRWTGTH